MKKAIIDLDIMKIIDHFDDKDSEKVKEIYENSGKYGFVGFDRDGDLTVSEDE